VNLLKNISEPAILQGRTLRASESAWTVQYVNQQGARCQGTVSASNIQDAIASCSLENPGCTVLGASIFEALEFNLGQEQKESSFAVNVEDRRGIVDQVFVDIAFSELCSTDALTLKAEVSRLAGAPNIGGHTIKLDADREIGVQIRKDGELYILRSELAFKLAPTAATSSSPIASAVFH
jgi:hypothetical protein